MQEFQEPNQVLLKSWTYCMTCFICGCNFFKFGPKTVLLIAAHLILGSLFSEMVLLLYLPKLCFGGI